ncbi:hypothetical protein KIL84_000928 [Mauremys mutica]|uniref:Uncharacterized protein n=1 Tax=Mauremys mutica TaxID=74926 RepID=A0A9D3WZ31_9SAUR|nr:hypothetical protein KIL84_000928 [Mauremys mutica]
MIWPCHGLCISWGSFEGHYGTGGLGELGGQIKLGQSYRNCSTWGQELPPGVFNSACAVTISVCKSAPESKGSALDRAKKLQHYGLDSYCLSCTPATPNTPMDSPCRGGPRYLVRCIC